MTYHDVSAVVAVVVAIAIGAERAITWFHGPRPKRPGSVCPIGADPEMRALIDRHNTAVERIGAVLTELRADHRLQDRRLDDIHQDLRELAA